MDWKPISLGSLQAEIDRGVHAMSDPDRAVWERVQVKPAKWASPPRGDLGGDFWVVGVLGQYVLWYNDIEDGFNVSRYSVVGTLDEYICNQDWLGTALSNLVKASEMDGGT
jgi:hypothetical protein